MSKANNVIKFIDKIKVVVGDSLQNVLTGLGVNGLDKSSASHFVNLSLSEGEK